MQTEGMLTPWQSWVVFEESFRHVSDAPLDVHLFYQPAAYLMPSAPFQVFATSGVQGAVLNIDHGTFEDAVEMALRLAAYLDRPGASEASYRVDASRTYSDGVLKLRALAAIKGYHTVDEDCERFLPAHQVYRPAVEFRIARYEEALQALRDDLEPYPGAFGDRWPTVEAGADGFLGLRFYGEDPDDEYDLDEED